MKKNLLWILSLLMVFMCFSCGKEETGQSVKELKSGYTLGYYIGNVTVTNNSKFRKVNLGMNFTQGDVISTGKGAIAEISVNKKGFIKISPSSSVRMAELMADNEKNIAQLNLEKGKVLVGISKLKKGARFKIKSKTAVASVRGTVFRVASAQKVAKIQVVKGVVRVNPVKNGEVLSNVQVDVSKGKAVDLSEEKVNEIMEKKETLEVKKLDISELEEISNEIKETQVVAKLDAEARDESDAVLKETDSQIYELKNEEKKKEDDKKREMELKKKAEKRRLEAIEKAKKEAEFKKRQEAARKKALLPKEKEDRVKNIPNF